jgi:hypothetical protein
MPVDWTQTPPPDKYGVPGINYPTPCPEDIIIIEEGPIRNQLPNTLPPQSLHDVRTDCRLTWQGPVHGDRNNMGVRRIFANDRLAQEQYNLDQGLSDLANADYPIFVRSYLLPRDFTPMVLGDPLTALVSVKVWSAGVTALADGIYSLTIDAPFSGTQATGKYQVRNSKVIGAYLTNSGSGYDAGSLPNVSAASTTAIITATMQPTLCILTDENVGKAEEMMEGRFVRVQRRWERVPGPLLSGIDTDERYGFITDYSKQVIPAGSLTSGILGSVVTGLNIISAGTGATSSSATLTIAAPGGGGTTALGTATIHMPATAGALASVVMDAGGTQYTSPPAVAFSGAGTGATGHSLLSPSLLDPASLSIDVAGSDITDAVLLEVIDQDNGPGSGAIVLATNTPVALDGAAGILISGGSGYDSTTTLVIGAPDVSGGTQATADPVLTGGVITGYSMTNAGSGYTKRPAVTVDPGTSGGSGGSFGPWTLLATSIASLQMTQSGSRYQSPEIVVHGSSTAVVSIKVKPTPVASVVIDTAGSGYAALTTTVNCIGGGGTSAAAHVTIASGYLSAVSLTNPGSLYTGAPAVTVTCAGLTGAVVSATIGSRTYVKVTPVDSIKSVAILSSLRKSSLPSPRAFPCAVHKKFDDTGSWSLVYAYGTNVDLGLDEVLNNGGHGSALATCYEYFLDSSDYEAMTLPSGFSTGGDSVTQTLWGANVTNGQARVWTFRVTPLVKGDRPGIVQMGPGEILHFDVYLVRIIVMS